MKNKFGNMHFYSDDDLNPMDGVSNLSDAMLVLAVGIMLALVINWKIDIGQQSSTMKVDSNKMEEFNQETAKVSGDVTLEDLESNYVKTGSVYQDVNTGKTYVVIEE